MRTFRNDRENLRDTRIAYTFLLSFALVCCILGMITTGLGSRLHKSELAECYRSLTLCADSLFAFNEAETEEERRIAEVRFENAVWSLPDEVELTPLSLLFADMSSGEVQIEAVRSYAETFALLASLDYADAKEARSTVSAVIQAISDANGYENSASETEAAAVSLPPETLKYSRKNASGYIDAVFGGGAGELEPKLSDDGGSWYAETENLRMTFSGKDGGLEGFIYIRVGDGAAVKENSAVPDSERIGSALDFFNSTRRYGKCDEASYLGEFCGFLLAELESGDEVYRVAVDSAGRVWSLMKVKR